MKPDTIERLRIVVQQTFHCNSQFVKAVPVSETYKGRPLWEGKVGIFRLEGSAGECYGWESDPQVGMSQPVIVPRTPEVSTPEIAVRSYILGSCEMAGSFEAN